MNLSTHFTLDEATHSQTAARLGIDNTPSAAALQNMRRAAEGMEGVRKALNNNTILVSSWFRNEATNRAVGSKPNSAHVSGFAVDFTCPAYGNPDTVVRALLASDLPFQQVIREYDRWVHIAFNGTARHALIIDAKGARSFA